MVNIWKDVTALVRRQRTFYTLGKRKEFRVIKENPSSLELEIGKQGIHIFELRKDFESVWQTLVEQGYFEPMQIRDDRVKFPFNRPAYIPAILAELPYIKVDRRGRRLALRVTEK